MDLSQRLERLEQIRTKLEGYRLEREESLVQSEQSRQLMKTFIEENLDGDELGEQLLQLIDSPEGELPPDERERILELIDRTTEEMKKSRGWGGARKGAGAKRKGKDKASVTIAFNIKELDADLLAEKAETGESRHQVARRLLLQLLHNQS